ncbi:hypothetical protein Llc71_23950 [Lactococcus cremoris]|uniref:hypothetical protein n=1 Tax=Lactococcus lactis subsp. cremoris TaxID=1359 RepID=UPI0020BE0DA9|nr:hypothetical protein [Lactococcus cremoris]BDE10700.1 hypothetical protein Llc71_23950 [Lactococcus cremoris]
MKKNKQTQESTDIIIGDKIVANLSFNAYETGALDAQLTINTPQDFHDSEEAKNELNELFSEAIDASKDKLATYEVPEK